MRERDATTTAARIERAIWAGLPGSQWQEAYRAECVDRVLQVVDEVVGEEHDRLRNQIDRMEVEGWAHGSPATDYARGYDQAVEDVLALLGESTQ